MPSIHMDIPSHHAYVISRAIGVEGKNTPFGEIVRIACSANLISLDIEAQDLTGLRAAVHSYLPWIDMAIKISNELGGIIYDEYPKGSTGEDSTI